MADAAPPRWRTPPAVLALLVAGTAAVLLAYGAAWLPGGAPRWASWAMVVGIALLLPGTLLLGAWRSGRPRSGLLIVALALGGSLLVVFGAALWLPDLGGSEPLLLGLPRRAAIVVYGAGLLPMLWMPWAFARDAGSRGADAERLERIRREAARLAAERQERG